MGDAELRELIGLLCEADYRSVGLLTSGIKWGGHQNAPDGGLDVVVSDTVSPPQKSFVPRSTTGFQVKASEIGPAEGSSLIAISRAQVVSKLAPASVDIATALAAVGLDQTTH